MRRNGVNVARGPHLLHTLRFCCLLCSAGYLPYNVSYYRKHFNVPASFNGTRVELYVDGALSASRWWLNGVALANGVTFTSGYTAIPLRLDTTPGFVAGGDNILVAFVDGTKKTGWWCVTE